MKRLLEEARRLVSLKSISSDGNEELANYCATLLEDRGVPAKLQQVFHSVDGISKRQFNVVGISGDPLVERKIRKGLLLLSGLDTTEPGLSGNWNEIEGRPFECLVNSEKIVGLGVQQGKLDFLAKVHAIAKFRERKLRQPVYIVGTCGEQLGMFGTKYLLQSQMLNPKHSVVGRPTELKVGVGCKAAITMRVAFAYQRRERDARGFNRRVDLHVTGRTTSAAYPSSGRSALLDLLNFLRYSMDAGFELQFTQVSSGLGPNQIPDQARAEFYLTSHQFQDFKRFFRETIQAEGVDQYFRADLGGLGDIGISFLPENLFSCLMQVSAIIGSEMVELEKDSSSRFDPAGCTANLTRLHQGAQLTEAVYDLRLLPQVSAPEFIDRLKNEIRKVAAQYPQLNLSVHVDQQVPGFVQLEGSAIGNICAEVLGEMGQPSETTHLSESSPAGLLAQKGYDVTLFGPGNAPGILRSPNEFVRVDDLEKAVLFYEKLIERVCL